VRAYVRAVEPGLDRIMLTVWHEADLPPIETDEEVVRVMSDLPPIADIRQREWHARCVPKAEIRSLAAIDLASGRE
jgi:hypothetical protein